MLPGKMETFWVVPISLSLNLTVFFFREPMDTIFSAYKHEFPTGALDYTSSFASLSDLYHSYRDLIVSLFYLVI